MPTPPTVALWSHPSTAVAVALLAVALAALAALGIGHLRRRLTSPAGTAGYRALHAASTAAQHLRDGLTPASAGRAARDLRPLLEVDAVALGDAFGVLAWEGRADHHRADFESRIDGVLATGRTVRLDRRRVTCPDPDCPIGAAILAPIVSDGRVVAVLASYHRGSTRDLVRATEAVATWISTQLDIADLERQRRRVVEAELLALRAQISPHFIYNSLGAIASFVRTDPDRARDLILEFADFTRYSFRSTGPLTPLADELVNSERYLALEEARFGDRMQVNVRIAPEVLGVQVPTFAVQPLVENAVQHGIEASTGTGTITIEAHDLGDTAEIVIEDDGAGTDPARIRAVLAGADTGDHVGLVNVDARLRHLFGEDAGLDVTTAPGRGTRVSFRVPKTPRTDTP